MHMCLMPTPLCFQIRALSSLPSHLVLRWVNLYNLQSSSFFVFVFLSLSLCLCLSVCLTLFLSVYLTLFLSFFLVADTRL